MQHVDHASLHPRLLRRHHHLLVLSLRSLGPQPQPLPLPVEAFYRHLLAFPEQHHDYRTVRRALVLLHDQQISVLDPGPHHALPHHPQQIPALPRTRREQLRRQRIGLVGRHGLQPTPGGDPAQQPLLPATPHPFSVSRTILRPALPRHVTFFLQSSNGGAPSGSSSVLPPPRSHAHSAAAPHPPHAAPDTARSSRASDVATLPSTNTLAHRSPCQTNV